ncbi:MAG: transposase [Candidatus Marinimicrobia bacterium]|nr:transposase [Candidatus Neomarinimicrobiota bacterium]
MCKTYLRITWAGLIDFALLPDSILSIDKGYIDYKWLYTLNQRSVYFVSRVKDNMKYEVTGQHRPLKNKQIIGDDLIKLQVFSASTPGKPARC